MSEKYGKRIEWCDHIISGLQKEGRRFNSLSDGEKRNHIRSHDPSVYAILSEGNLYFGSWHVGSRPYRLTTTNQFGEKRVDSFLSEDVFSVKTLKTIADIIKEGIARGARRAYMRLPSDSVTGAVSIPVEDISSLIEAGQTFTFYIEE